MNPLCLSTAIRQIRPGQHKPQVVVNLAAQAGVRCSITNPDAYIESTIIGFHDLLEACRRNPVSLYAATRKSTELLAHSCSKLCNIPSTGLSFLPYTILPDVRIWPVSASDRPPLRDGLRKFAERYKDFCMSRQLFLNHTETD